MAHQARRAKEVSDEARLYRPSCISADARMGSASDAYPVLRIVQRRRRACLRLSGETEMTQTIEQLRARIAELEEEVERLKIDVEFWKGYSKAKLDDLLQQLAAEQLNNKLLRKALEAVIKVHGYESGIPVEAISTQANTEALDAYVKQKIKEYY